jgi:hypothetical protein
MAQVLSVQRRISRRGQQRLRIAARLLLRAVPSEVTTDDDWCGRVLMRIDCLPENRRAHLRDLVDWVEAYEDAEQPVRPSR